MISDDKIYSQAKDTCSQILHVFYTHTQGISIHRHNKEFSLISDFTNCGNLWNFCWCFLKEKKDAVDECERKESNFYALNVCTRISPPPITVKYSLAGSKKKRIDEKQLLRSRRRRRRERQFEKECKQIKIARYGVINTTSCAWI